jgi:hypothetical protein
MQTYDECKHRNLPSSLLSPQLTLQRNLKVRERFSIFFRLYGRFLIAIKSTARDYPLRYVAIAI